MEMPQQPPERFANPLDEILRGQQPTPTEAFQVMAQLAAEMQAQGKVMLQLYKALNVLHSLVEEHEANRLTTPTEATDD